MYVYFVRDLGTGLIKIGRTNNVAKRIAALRTACSSTLQFLGATAKEDEKILHARFASQRVRGEWFHPSPDLLELAKSCEVGTGATTSKQHRSKLFGVPLIRLAKELGVEKASVNRWARQFRKHGQIRQINGQKLAELAVLVGVSADEILGIHVTASSPATSAVSSTSPTGDATKPEGTF